MEIEPEKALRLVFTLSQMKLLREAQMTLWSIRTDGPMPGYADTIGWLLETFKTLIDGEVQCENGQEKK